MELGKLINLDFSKLDLSFLKNEEIQEDAMLAMSSVLSHNQFIEMLSDHNVKCHVDSYFRPVSQKEAAIRISRGGHEYSCMPIPVNDTFYLNLRSGWAMELMGALSLFLKQELQSIGINADFEARCDLNRFHTAAALYPSGKIHLIFDAVPIYPHGSTEEEMLKDLMAPVSDLTAACMIVSLFHLAMHAVQLHRFHQGKLDSTYKGMKTRFLEGCQDPAYYYASYPENLMDIEAEFAAAGVGVAFFSQFWPDMDAKAFVHGYLCYKAIRYNSEYLVLPPPDDVFKNFDMAYVGLCQKMFKTEHWYQTQPDHDRMLSADEKKRLRWDAPGNSVMWK